MTELVCSLAGALQRMAAMHTHNETCRWEGMILDIVNLTDVASPMRHSCGLVRVGISRELWLPKEETSWG